MPDQIIYHGSACNRHRPEAFRGILSDDALIRKNTAQPFERGRPGVPIGKSVSRVVRGTAHGGAQCVTIPFL